MQSLLNAVKSESAPGNYTCLAFQLLANHAGSHPDQMVGVTPRLVRVRPRWLVYRHKPAFFISRAPFTN
jgi:hypothetical protein